MSDVRFKRNLASARREQVAERPRLCTCVLLNIASAAVYCCCVLHTVFNRRHAHWTDHKAPTTHTYTFKWGTKIMQLLLRARDGKICGFCVCGIGFWASLLTCVCPVAEDLCLCKLCQGIRCQWPAFEFNNAKWKKILHTLIEFFFVNLTEFIVFVATV